MAMLITDECISCGACEAECPTSSITEGEIIYVINPDTCTECVGFHDESQCVSVCPVEAIINDPDRKESSEELEEKKIKLFGE